LARVLKVETMNKCLGCFTCMLICAAFNRKDHSIKKSCIKIRTSGGMEGRFVSVVCQACGNPPCAEVCPSDALSPREGGGVLLDPSKCIGCRRCVGTCVVGAIGYDEDIRKPIICHHCGLCAQYCPHGCLVAADVK